MFNFNHLYYFYMTARLGGVSKVSQALNTSQPSLSAQIKVLEKTLNRKLFQKLGRNMQLTPEGERIFQYCQRIFSTAEELERFLNDSEKTETVQFKIGVTEQIEMPFVADLISKLSQSKLQKKRIKITSGKKEELLDLLRAQQINLALMNSPAYGQEFMDVAHFEMPVGLFVSNELHKTMVEELEPAKIKSWLRTQKIGLVIPSEKLKLRHETDQYLERNDIKSEVALESDALSVVVRAVLDGVGIGFIPQPYLAEKIIDKSVVQLFVNANLWSHKLYMIARTSETLDPVVQDMVLAMDRIKARSV